MRNTLIAIRPTSLVALAVLAPAVAAQSVTRLGRENLTRYELHVLPPFSPGGTAFSQATAVNDLGEVTGTATAPGERAFLWTAAGGMVDLGESPSALTSIGRDVNLLGMVAGSSGTAALWPGDGSIVSIPPPPGGAYAPFAFGLNERGRVVGQANLTANLRTGWVWDPSLGTRDLRNLGVPGAWTAAAINEQNQIVGERLAFTHRAYLFDLDTQALTDLGTFGGPSSEALGLNDLGHVVGWAMNANYNTRPFLWTPGGGLAELGSLGGQPYDFGKAYSVNGAGQVVGHSATATGVQHAFLWDARNGMRDLNALVRDTSVDGLGTFELVTAVRISDTGWIVGNGHDTTPGSLSRGYVLRPRGVHGRP